MSLFDSNFDFKIYVRQYDRYMLLFRDFACSTENG